jgi:hypothetical protein
LVKYDYETIVNDLYQQQQDEIHLKGWTPMSRQKTSVIDAAYPELAPILHQKDKEYKDKEKGGNPSRQYGLNSNEGKIKNYSKDHKKTQWKNKENNKNVLNEHCYDCGAPNLKIGHPGCKAPGSRKHVPNNNSQSSEVLEGYKKKVQDLQKQKAVTLVSDAKTQTVKRDLNIGILKNNMHSWSDSKFFANTSTPGHSKRNTPSRDNEDRENPSEDFNAAIRERIRQTDPDMYEQVIKARNRQQNNSYILPVFEKPGGIPKSSPLANIKEESTKSAITDEINREDINQIKLEINVYNYPTFSDNRPPTRNMSPTLDLSFNYMENTKLNMINVIREEVNREMKNFKENYLAEQKEYLRRIYEEMARDMQTKHEKIREECRRNSQREKKELLYNILSIIRKEMRDMLNSENLMNANNLIEVINEKLETITQTNLLDVLTNHQTEMYENITAQIQSSIERILRRIEQSSSNMEAKIVNTGQNTATTIQDNSNIKLTNSINELTCNTGNVLTTASFSNDDHTITSGINNADTIDQDRANRTALRTVVATETSADSDTNAFEEVFRRAQSGANRSNVRHRDLPPASAEIRRRTIQGPLLPDR